MKISFKHVLITGWNIFKKHWKFIISLGILTTLAQIFVSGIYQTSQESGAILTLALWAVSTLVSIIISLGWSKVFLGFIRNDHASWETFKTDSKIWLQLIKVTLWYIAYTIGYTLIAAVPLGIIAAIAYSSKVSWLMTGALIAIALAFILVAIYMSIRYQFISYTVLDYSNLSSHALFKKSGAITHKSFWQLFLFSIISGLVIILGLICLIVGLVIAIPVVKIAQAKLYELLKAHSESTA